MPPAMTDDERAASEAATRATMQGRFDQAFPVFTPAEIERVRRFGNPRRYADGQALQQTGNPTPGMSLLLSGHVAVTTRDGLGRVAPIVELGPGQFLAELGALAHHAPSLVDAHAEGDVEIVLLPPDALRALLVAEAQLGERIMRAAVLRRVALIDTGGGGPLLIGAATSSSVIRLQGFLRRNGMPQRVLDPATDALAADLVAHIPDGDSRLPLVVCPNGALLHDPPEDELARELGQLDDLRQLPVYDVAIVGCGPAGLSTAVYAASEGLAVVVLDARSFGGQAGASARIENYFGFPTGISGLALTARGFSQAQKFGAEMLIPVEVSQLDCSRSNGTFELVVSGGTRLRARAVVVATGARYRRLALDNVAELEGRGIWYWASPIEAQLCAAQEVIVVGGGNSAGQAAVFLSEHAAKVRVMVRSTGLAASMSRYLIDRLTQTPNIELMTETEIVQLEGTPDAGLQRVRWRTRAGGHALETTADIRNVFSFVGADPATAWLRDCGVQLDRNGFVLAGKGTSPLESTVPGVFAVGDVRLGSVKRVGSAIGEGAQVVAALHAFLAEREPRA